MNSAKKETGGPGSQRARTETTTFEWTENDAVISAVVSTVSSVTGNEPTELRPLAKVIDTDALDSLFRRTEPESGYVQFEYEGCLVRVTADGEVRATPVS